MNKCVYFSLSVMVICQALVADATTKAAMKQATKEAKDLSKQQRESLIHKEQRLNSVESESDLLPESDRNKEFDVDAMHKQLKHPGEIAEGSELHCFLKTTAKREEFEGTEDFLLQGRLVIEDPEKYMGATAHVQHVQEEEKLEKCQENGIYQVSFNQKRIVQVTPEIKNKVKYCKGHERKKHFFWEKDADHRIKKEKKELSEDTTIASFKVYKHGGNLVKKYEVIMQWKHKEDVDKCNEYELRETLAQSSSEQEWWQTDFPERLSAIEQNPSCTLLYSQVLSGPDVRNIAGKSIFKDVWERELIFSCEPQTPSRCLKLRELGGVLIHKKCLQENDFGECELWEKTYDLGKMASYKKNNMTFEDQDIWDPSEASDSSYEKNTEFGDTITTLAIFADLKSDIERLGTDFSEESTEVFQGEKMKCKKSLLQGQLYDCCKKMEGLAVKTHLAFCNSEEKCLAEQRYEGKCHFVGSQKIKMGTETEQVFCCFPTKLALVLQEQGRKQLGIKWGSTDKPECRGLTIKELQSIDFSQLDLSDVTENLKVDKQTMVTKVSQGIADLKANQQQALNRTQETLQNLEEKRQQDMGILPLDDTHTMQGQ